MNTPSGKLILLSGPSGVGKTTVAKRIVAISGFERVVTATTRSPRPDERDGVDYHFLSTEEFDEGIHSGRFLEYARVYGRWYGTPRDSVVRGLSQKKWLVLTVDIQGARQILAKGREFPLTTFFLVPPTLDSLKERLGKRGTESQEEMARRTELAVQELKEEPLFDHKIVNDEVGRAVSEILRVVNPSGSPEEPRKDAST